MPRVPLIMRRNFSGEPAGLAFAHFDPEDAMPRTWTWTIALALLGVTVQSAAAQDVRPGVFGAVGIANVRRAEDRSFGTELNAGGGAGIEWKRLGLDAEAHKTIGLTPRAAQCGVVNVPCTGSAREGFSEATMLTGNVSYFFGSGRVRPYVTGSVGVLWTTSVNSIVVATSTLATLSEFEQHNAGLALGIGAGVDIPVTGSLSIRPEFRTYSSVAMSSVNLDIHRLVVAMRYRW
ncbi:MAG TPA: outer membrane beta-barrel protein [Vicinamibacterales bacterium]|nr:outer membrane beta-barrel protein [Vicinamibacterales bacterium]